VVARGDAAACYQGLWASNNLEQAGLVMHKTYDYTQLPDPKILMASPAGIVAFANSGEEEAGIAVIMCFMTKEFQTKWAQGKNVVPIRTDIELDPNVFS
jgi:ABC-type glycerol-3-phosphate transport system substrate-binding protein